MLTNDFCKCVLVDFFAPLLGDGTTAELLAEDIRAEVPQNTKTRAANYHRNRIRNAVGSNAEQIQSLLDTLVGIAGTRGGVLRRSGEGRHTSYYVK